ncbi:MAG TPA: Holliday junction branch migration protein RuvA [Thermoanaerobaculia bacterium]|nr:Holliday junction branch migration protein RuvA [Thermoanaerobaculia bacterium]
MIGWLRGALRRITPERVVLDVDGVGYLLRVPLSTYYELERIGEGGTAELLIHTHVREDALELFGFLSDAEKALFERLIGVSGIGPRLAQVILSGMAPADVLQALAAGDVARLVRIPGVGKKTAERMVVELRDAAAELARAAPSGSAAPAVPSEDSDLVQALVNLGYRPADAERAVGAVRREHAEAPFRELLRMSLRRLSRV